MPIYAYRCSNCGNAQDVLQRMSDAVLSVCPACGQSTYVKQVTAAGFQLKGSGWYVTDFRGDKKAASADVDKSDAKEVDGTRGEAKAGDAAGPAGDAAGPPGDAAARNGDGAKKVEAGAAPAPGPAPAPAPAPAGSAAGGKPAG